MVNPCPMAVKDLRAFVLCLSMVFNGLAPGGAEAAPGPDEILPMKAPDGRSYDVPLYTLDHEKLRQCVRGRRHLPESVPVKYRDHSLQTRDCVLDWVAGAVGEGGAREFSNILAKRLTRTMDPTVHPVTLMHRNGPAFLVIPADEKVSSREWVSGFMGVDPSLIREDNTGIDRVILTDFINYHERGHVIGGDEAQADGYASCMILRDHGAGDETRAVLQFVADNRLTWPRNVEYVHGYTRIQEMLLAPPTLAPNPGAPGFDSPCAFSRSSAGFSDTAYFTRIFGNRIEEEQRTGEHLDVVGARGRQAARAVADQNPLSRYPYKEIGPALRRMKSLMSGARGPSLYRSGPSPEGPAVRGPG